MASLYESINNNNNNSEPNSDEFWYDKNEFYSENGLVKGRKKDSKSHGIKAQQQQQLRDEKVSKQVLLLPKKMQKAIKALQKDKDKDFKEKEDPESQVKYIKTINRKGKGKGKNADFALDDDFVAEDDVEEVDEDLSVDEEVDDFVADAVEVYDLSTQTYIKAKREFDLYASDWSEEDLQKFKETIDRYEALGSYAQGLKMWQMYGLTEAQYAANQEKEMITKTLFEEWYYDEEHQDAIYAQEDEAAAEYADWLEAKEKEEEERLIAIYVQQEEEEEKDMADAVVAYALEKDKEDQAAEYDDWLEAYEEERRDNAMQNCIDDMYSDCDSD